MNSTLLPPTHSRKDLAAIVRAKLLSMSRGDVLTATLAADAELTEPEAAEALGCSVEEFRRRHAAVVEEIRSALPSSDK
jgi:hypothetical protein